MTVTNTSPVDAGKPYADVSLDNQNNKRAALEAMANGGTAARQEIENTQNQINASKANAVQQALLESRQFNAPAEAQQNVSAQISAPYDLRVNSLSQGQAARAQDMNTRSAGDATYFDKIASLTPLYQDQARTAYDKARARIDAQNALQAQQMQWQANLAQAQLANDQAQQAWNQQFQEKQLASQNEQWQKTFDENVREYGLDYALKVAAAQRAAAGGGGGGGGGGGRSGGSSGSSNPYSQFGSNLTQQRAALQSMIQGDAAALNSLNPKDYPRSTTAAENMPHNQFVSQLIDQSIGVPVGTTANMVPKAFIQPTPLPPPTAPEKGGTYQDIYNKTVTAIQNGRAQGLSDGDIVDAIIQANPNTWNTPPVQQAMRQVLGLVNAPYRGLVS